MHELLEASNVMSNEAHHHPDAIHIQVEPFPKSMLVTVNLEMCM